LPDRKLQNSCFETIEKTEGNFHPSGQRFGYLLANAPLEVNPEIGILNPIFELLSRRKFI